MTFRLYFNRCEDWPQIWSIDSGDVSTECNVIDWRCEPGVTMRAGRADGEVSAREPRAWCIVECAGCRVEDGVAVFSVPYDAWPRGAVNRAVVGALYVCCDSMVCRCGRAVRRDEGAHA